MKKALIGFSVLVIFQSSFAYAASTTLSFGKSQLSVSFPEKNPLSEKVEIAWLTRAAHSLTAYFGYFPVKNVAISIKARSRYGAIFGRTYDADQIDFFFGESITEEKLNHDWTATHEMFHLAFPDVEDQEWLGEGLSTYLEPISRVRTGDLAAEKLWASFEENLSEGLPKAGDLGLNATHTWGRTYWGGCLFWFVADIKIREATQNRKSLDDGIRAILKEGGNGAVTWAESRIFKTIDQATGTHIMKDLNEKMVLNPGTVDLPEIWRRLGVAVVSSKIVYDDHAPLAGIRKSMIKQK